MQYQMNLEITETKTHQARYIKISDIDRFKQHNQEMQK